MVPASASDRGAPPLAEALRDTFRSGPVLPCEIAPEVLSSAEVTGAEPLLRRRITDALSDTERFQTLEFVRRERWLRSAFAELATHGIAAATFKGWSLARLYGRPGLRPVGDIDLLVRPEDLAHATAVVGRLDAEELDIQADLSRYLPDRRVDSLLVDAEEASVGGVAIRVLRPADHLRLVCLHQLHHGSWRPLWLCDVAVLLESLPADFSWEECLAGNRNLRDGVLACAQLACEWLGARPTVAPPPSTVPAWFRAGFRRAWARGYRETPAALEGISWSRLPRALRDRWPDPFSSTLHLRARFHNVPRFPLQVMELARRASLHALRRLRISRMSDAPTHRPA